jgi:hypothetical protein
MISLFVNIFEVNNVNKRKTIKYSSCHYIFI